MGLFSETLEPQTIRRAGQELRCGHCGHSQFYSADAQLGTQGQTLLNLEWLGRSARYYICARCGHLEWFVAVPERA